MCSFDYKVKFLSLGHALSLPCASKVRLLYIWLSEIVIEDDDKLYAYMPSGDGPNLHPGAKLSSKFDIIDNMQITKQSDAAHSSENVHFLKRFWSQY